MGGHRTKSTFSGLPLKFNMDLSAKVQNVGSLKSMVTYDSLLLLRGSIRKRRKGLSVTGSEKAIPPGMKAYGLEHPDYPDAPKDWDHGPYLCRDGEMYHMRGYGWGHGIGCWNPTASWDRIAYTPAKPN